MPLRRRSEERRAGVAEFEVDRESCSGLLADSLWEFLARNCWDANQSRERGTIMLLCQDGVWKLWLNDKETGDSCWISGPTVRELLSLAADGLETGGLPWRVQKGRRK